MTAYVNDSGSWKQVTNMHIKDGGTWKEVVVASVKDADVWKEVHNLGPWPGITDPENQVSWSASTTLSNPQSTVLTWPSDKRFFKAYIYGAGGGNSNGGQGAEGGYSVLYLGKGGLIGNTYNLVAVVGDPGQYGNPGGPYTRNCAATGNCSSPYTYGTQSSRGFGGRPGTGQGPHNWGSTGGGFSGVFINDNNTTSSKGYNYFYCTPVAIAGGGGGGQAYGSNARAGGGYSIAASVHYQSPPAAFNSLDVIDLNFQNGNFGTDGDTQCFSSCVFSTYPVHPYLRNEDGNTGGGFASGSSCQGGTGFIYGKDGVHLSALGFNRNSGTLSDLTNLGSVHPNSFTQNGGGSANSTAGRIVYHWGT